MTSSANVPKATNIGGIEPGGISPEDAERFAASFKPSWDFDDAPFAAEPAKLSDSDIRELSAGGVNADVAAALTSTTAPAAKPVSRPPPPPASVRPPKPVSRPAPAVAQRPPKPSTGDASSSMEIDLKKLKKSNKTIYIAAGVAVLGLAAFFGMRAATSEPDTSAPATAHSSVPVTPHDEPRIPPPPAANDIPPAKTVAATTAAPAPEPPKPEPPKPEPVKPDPPKVEKPVAAQVTQPAAPPPRAASPRAEHPRAAAASPAPKPKAAGGIVRDNPF